MEKNGHFEDAMADYNGFGVPYLRGNEVFVLSNEETIS